MHTTLDSGLCANFFKLYLVVAKFYPFAIHLLFCKFGGFSPVISLLVFSVVFFRRHGPI